MVLRAPMKWSPPAVAGCVAALEPSLRVRVRAYRALTPSQGHSLFYPLGGLLGGLAQPAQPGRPSRILLTAGCCWLLVEELYRLQIAQIYGTAEICKTGIQQPLRQQHTISSEFSRECHCLSNIYF